MTRGCTKPAIAMFLCACGPSVSLRVQQRSLRDLPLESRLDLLDAENDLFGAVDRRDDASQAIDDARVAGRRADQRCADAEHNLELARHRHDQAGVDVGLLAVAEARARRRLQQWDLESARRQEASEEARLLVAQARFERARAEVAKKAKSVGAAELQLKDFDRQIEQLSRHAKSVQEEADRRQKDSQPDRARWLALSRQLSQLTGGAQGSAWVQ